MWPTCTIIVCTMQAVAAADRRQIGGCQWQLSTMFRPRLEVPVWNLVPFPRLIPFLFSVTALSSLPFSCLCALCDPSLCLGSPLQNSYESEERCEFPGRSGRTRPTNSFRALCIVKHAPYRYCKSFQAIK